MLPRHKPFPPTTLAIISQKGGSGRTTLSIHLAVQADLEGISVAVIDMDPQATAALWSTWRGADTAPDIIDCSPPLLTAKIKALRAQGCDLIIIDTPPHADTIAVAAATAADIVLVPVRPRAFDLAAAQTTYALTSRLNKPTWAVLVGGSSRATTINREAAAALDIPVAPITLPERADFHRGAGDGKAAQDIAPNGKAAGEAAALLAWLRTQVKGARK